MSGARDDTVDAPAPELTPDEIVEADAVGDAIGDKRAVPEVVTEEERASSKAPRLEDTPSIVTTTSTAVHATLPAEAAPSIITATHTVMTAPLATLAVAPAVAAMLAAPSLVASATIGAASTVGQDYTQAGPFATVVGADSLLIAGTAVHLYMTITAPKVASDFEKFPVVLFLNGFEMKEAWYKPYADRVASYGYIVLQYDVNQVVPPAISLEYKYIENLLDKVTAKSTTPGDMLYGIVDVTTWATMGHSRGGKLAAMQLATYPYVKTSCLIDPVDELQPSAAGILKGQGKLAALVGCGITGPANPANVNYSTFEAVLGDGCWVQVIKQAGHAQVVDLPKLEAALYDKLCGYGNITHAHAIALATVPCVAWLEGFFHPKTDLTGFFQWVDSEKAAGEVAFTITPEVAPAPLAFDFEAANAAELAAA